MKVFELAQVLWLTFGFWFLMEQAKGEQLADIRPAWCRQCAIILTFPMYLAIWACMRAVFLVGDIWQLLKTAADSWNGIHKEVGDE